MKNQNLGFGLMRLPQPDPSFGAEHNYFSAEKAKHGLHKDDRCIPAK